LYLSVESDESTAKYFIDWFGDDNLVFSTDYPHGDSKYPLAVANFLQLPISEESKKKILWDNWARLYGLTALPSGAAGSGTRDRRARLRRAPGTRWRRRGALASRSRGM